MVIVGYLVLVLYIGLYFRKRMHSAEDYFAGGHNVPWWLAGVSHYISSASALSFVAYSQLGYTYGFVAITVAWSAVPGCLLGGLVFARRWRQARVSTPVEFLERRFNKFVRQLMAWAGIPMKIGEDGLKLFATSLFLSVGLQIPVSWAVLVCGAIAIAYTFFGGLWALAVTDYVQFLMKALALLLLVPLACTAFWRAGGIHHAAAVFPPHFFHVTNGHYNWIYVAGFVAMLAITLNGSWALAQKYYSVADTRQAEKAAYLSAALYFVGTPLMIVPAILGRAFLPDLIAQHRTADVYVFLILRLLPAGMVGVVVAALLSATMAAVSADFSSIAGVITKDIYQRLLRPDTTPKGLLLVGKLITLLVGSLSVATALYLSTGGDQPILHLMVLIAGAFIAPSFLPLMGALVSRRLTSQGVITGFFLGLTSGLALLGLRSWVLPHGYWPWLRANYDGASLLINTGMTIIGMWAGTQISRATATEGAKYDSIFSAGEQPRAPVPVGGRPIDLEKIISTATLAVAALLAVAGLLAPSSGARFTDLLIALCLAALGWFRLRRARFRSESKPLETATKT